MDHPTVYFEDVVGTVFDGEVEKLGMKGGPIGETSSILHLYDKSGPSHRGFAMDLLDCGCGHANGESSSL